MKNLKGKIFRGLIVTAAIVLTATACSSTPKTVLTENFPVEERWSKWVANDSTVTMDLTVSSDSVAAITIGGTPEFHGIQNKWNRDKANARYYYSGTANTAYVYKFEAWTASGSGNRPLTICYYNDNTENKVLWKEIVISETKRTYIIIGNNLPKDGIQYLSFSGADKLGTFYTKILEIREARPGEPDNWPVEDRWNSYGNITTTVDYTIGDEGLVTATVGGISTNDRWLTGVQYNYSGTVDTAYVYTFEAWTEPGSDSRELNIQYYQDYNEGVYLNRNISINDTKKTYTIRGEKLLKSGNWSVEFQCGDQFGTFYVKALEITEAD